MCVFVVSVILLCVKYSFKKLSDDQKFDQAKYSSRNSVHAQLVMTDYNY